MYTCVIAVKRYTNNNHGFEKYLFFIFHVFDYIHGGLPSSCQGFEYLAYIRQKFDIRKLVTRTMLSN